MNTEATATPKTRVYLVNTPTDKLLVRATSKSTAIRYAAKKSITAEVANQDTIIGMLSDGAKVVDGTTDDDAE